MLHMKEREEVRKIAIEILKECQTKRGMSVGQIDLLAGYFEDEARKAINRLKDRTPFNYFPGKV